MAYIAHEKALDRLNWKIYELYVTHQTDACLQLIESQLYNSRGLCEYAIFIKGLIERNTGNISESLELFQASTALNPHNINNLKQVARSLYLLGRYEAAIEIYEKAQEIECEDWEIWHHRGLCLENLGKLDECIESYESANAVQQHDSTFIRLANVYIQRKDQSSAIETLKEALEYSPESSLLLTTLGLLYLKIKDTFNAFTTLGSSLALDPTNPTTILAAGSIIQNNQDIDVALVKYRVAALQSPNSSRLWNNIGMCFYSKRKFVESISAFRRAVYLNPFDWSILFNLGLVYMATSNFASAFHQFSAAINLNNRYPPLFLYLAVSLCYLDDIENGQIAFQRALQLSVRQREKKEAPKSKGKSKGSESSNQSKDGITECLIHINWAIMLMKRVRILHQELFGSATSFRFKDDSIPKINENADEEDKDEIAFQFEQMKQFKNEALEHYKAYRTRWKALDEEARSTELGTVSKQQSLLESIFH